jgi:hypothetical protein
MSSNGDPLTEFMRANLRYWEALDHIESLLPRFRRSPTDLPAAWEASAEPLRHAERQQAWGEFQEAIEPWVVAAHDVVSKAKRAGIKTDPSPLMVAITTFVDKVFDAATLREARTLMMTLHAEATALASARDAQASHTGKHESDDSHLVDHDTAIEVLEITSAQLGRLVKEGKLHGTGRGRSRRVTHSSMWAYKQKQVARKKGRGEREPTEARKSQNEAPTRFIS